MGRGGAGGGARGRVDRRAYGGGAPGRRPKKKVRGADSRLKDLKLTVDYVERDRATFQHIDDAELESRRAFIASTRDALAAVKASVNGDKTRRKMEADERKQFAAQSDGDTLGATSATSLENTRFVRDQKTKQQVGPRRWRVVARGCDTTIRPPLLNSFCMQGVSN